ncbi:MAG TPA: hypothetical protein VFV89_17620 [Nocardioides sp.]|nr:hypothetical protein [Nocardioides sp.]HEX5089631.1 hypothetical protein [Nocardioides sp.]
MSDSVRWIFRTVEGDRTTESRVTQAWTSAWETCESRTEPQVGTT